jgi:hypothetical protein
MPALRTALVPLVTLVTLGAGLAFPTPAAAATPTVGSCYEYPATTIGKASSAAPAIPCEAPHTAETYWVGTVPDSFGLPSQASTKARLRVTQACTEDAMNAYLGLDKRRIPSRFTSVALFPTDAQWQAGERWVRCDTVLKAGRQLTSITGSAATFAASVGPARLDSCTIGTPKPLSTAEYRCTQPKKNWILVAERELGSLSDPYPGDAAVVRQATRICERYAKRYDGGLEYPGWWRLNPLRPLWQEGERTVRCYVPLYQYQDSVSR